MICLIKELVMRGKVLLLLIRFNHNQIFNKCVLFGGWLKFENSLVI